MTDSKRLLITDIDEAEKLANEWFVPEPRPNTPVWVLLAKHVINLVAEVRQLRSALLFTAPRCVNLNCNRLATELREFSGYRCDLHSVNAPELSFASIVRTFEEAKS